MKKEEKTIGREVRGKELTWCSNQRKWKKSEKEG